MFRLINSVLIIIIIFFIVTNMRVKKVNTKYTIQSNKQSILLPIVLLPTKLLIE